MKINRAILFVLILSLFTIPLVSAQGGGKKGELLVENDKIAVKIIGNGNVPQFQFWQPGENETNKFQVKFIRLFEVIDENDDYTYNPGNETKEAASNNALAKLSWTFSDKVTEGDMIHFNITSEDEDFTIQFRNHFDTNEASLKFDIVIEDYTFKSADEKAMLVLAFHLIASQEDMNQNQNRINFGNKGYFESETQAQAGNETIEAGISKGEDSGNNAAFISFTRFTGRMVHDPTIGLDGSSANIPGYEHLWLLSLPVMGLIYFGQQRTRKL